MTQNRSFCCIPDTVVDAGTVGGAGRRFPGRNRGRQCLGKHHGPQVDSVYDHMRSMRRSSTRPGGVGKTTGCEDFSRPARVVAGTVDGPRGAFYSRRDNSGSAIFERRAFRYNTGSVMSNIPVAFLVLGAFFTLYFVAALWRSRPK
jgi:hypothetical protein